jgi:hypothetical protein
MTGAAAKDSGRAPGTPSSETSSPTRPHGKILAASAISLLRCVYWKRHGNSLGTRQFGMAGQRCSRGDYPGSHRNGHQFHRGVCTRDHPGHQAQKMTSIGKITAFAEAYALSCTLRGTMTGLWGLTSELSSLGWVSTRRFDPKDLATGKGISL